MGETRKSICALTFRARSGDLYVRVNTIIGTRTLSREVLSTDINVLPFGAESIIGTKTFSRALSTDMNVLSLGVKSNVGPRTFLEPHQPIRRCPLLLINQTSTHF